MLGMAPAVASSAGQTVSQNIPCNTTFGWITLASNGDTSKSRLSIYQESKNENSLQWTVTREKEAFTAILNSTYIGNLSTLKFDIYSQVNTILLVHIEDTDHAKFNCPINLEAGKWKRVKIGPTDFRLADDSPVKKSSLDPARLAVGFGLVDAGGILGNPTPNTLRLRNMSVERGKIASAKVPRIIDSGVFTLLESGDISNDIIVRNGATLRINAPRVSLSANIILDGGKLEVRKSLLTINGRFPHDRTIAGKRSTISFTDCVVTVNNMVNVNLDDNARLEIKRTEFNGGGFTIGAITGCSIALEQVKRPGEFVIMPGANLQARDCDDLLFWPWFGSTNKAAVTFPDGKSIASWKMPDAAKINMELAHCRGVLWGLVLDTGADVSIKNSTLRALGISFTSKTPQSLVNIKNKTPTASLKLNLGDRRLQLTDTTVETWNVYPREVSYVTIRDCLCGEVMSFDTAKALMENSVCDGTGGYIAAKGKSQLRLVGCRLNCPVSAVDQSTLILESCTVDGSVSASDSATVTLIGTKVKGTKSENGKGRIITK